MNKYRTHNCNELRKDDLDKDISISGWINKKRDHGNLLFIDLRDNYGITQCIIDKENKFDENDKSTEESLININVDNDLSKENNQSSFEDNSNKNNKHKKICSSINIVIDKKILNSEEESEYDINEIYDCNYNENESKKDESNKSLSYLVSNITNHDISIDYDDL